MKLNVFVHGSVSFIIMFLFFAARIVDIFSAIHCDDRPEKLSSSRA